MDAHNILNLAEHVLVRLNESGEVTPLNVGAHALFAKVFGTTEVTMPMALSHLFQVSQWSDIAAAADSGRTLSVTVRLNNQEERQLKWEFTRLNSNVDVITGVAVNWAPVRQLIEQISHENLLFKELVLNILPHHVADELIDRKAVRPKAYRHSTIIFTDVVSFSKLAFHLDPVTLIRRLNDYFSIYDDLMGQYALEKIKTIGDSYMCTSGLPVKKETRAVDCALAALAMIKATIGFKSEPNLVDGLDLNNWQIRLGIHTGPAISGVVGNRKYIFDIWGDSVNVASRMESAGAPSKINISDATYERVKDFFDCTYRGSQEVKNIGPVHMYFLNRIKPELSADEEGTEPNEVFLTQYCDMFNLKPGTARLSELPVVVREYLQQ